MKKLILAMMLIIPMGLAAQSKSFDDLFAKYEGTEGFLCMNLAGDMLKSMQVSEDTEEILKGISSMALIVAEKSTEEFRKDLKATVKKGDYKSIMSLDAEGSKVELFVAKKDAGKGNDEEKEMLLLVSGSDGTDVAINMIGKGDPAKIMESVDF